MLDIFKFKNYPVRFVFLDGEIWFVAIDIAAILEYLKVDKMLNLVDAEDQRVENPHKLDSSILEETFDSNTFRVSLINESGLYACIFGSTKPEAKAFKRWVTSELLPTLRKTVMFEVIVDDRLEVEKLKLEIEKLKLEKEVNSLNNSLLRTEDLVAENHKVIQQSMQCISVLEDEKFHREFYLKQIHEITTEHPLFNSLLQFGLMIKSENYNFPDVAYTVRQILDMFNISTSTERRFSLLCSALYWLNYNKKPNETGVYTYQGKDLIYPSLILFKQENYDWKTIKFKFEMDYKIRFPSSNRKELKQLIEKNN